MKISESRLRQILKEELDQELKNRIYDLYQQGSIGQAFEFAQTLDEALYEELRNDLLSKLPGGNYRRRDLSGLDLTGADLEGTYLTGADLSNANLTNANLAGTYLRNADLSGADLTGTNIEDAYYPEAAKHDETTKFPQGFDIQTHKTDLERMKSVMGKKIHMLFKSGKHQEAIKRSNQLRLDVFFGADLSNQYLANVNLKNAVLTDANLYGANLDGANLKNADLRTADLSYASLIGANLEGANLKHAYLDGTDLLNVKYDEGTQWPANFNMKRITEV